MKILTWNLQRLEKNKNDLIIDILLKLDADILILTEASNLINLGTSYTIIASNELPKFHDGINYKIGERRTIVFTKYKVKQIFKPTDGYTSAFCELETPFGELLVYGTIIGVLGGIGQRFKEDLQQQISDFNTFFKDKNVCLAGDFNVMLSGRSYPSKESRITLNDVFKRFDLECLTKDLDVNVDHIVLSNMFIEGKQTSIEVWNLDKKLSDHIGICISIV